MEEANNQLKCLETQELDCGSNHSAAFNKAKSQWMVLTHKPPLTSPPKLRLGDFELTPQPRIKWLGVIIDPKLKFTENVNTQVASQLVSIARTGWGIPLKQCLKLISSLVHFRIDYAGVVCHRY